jgi:hypothetical protein
MPSGVSLHGRLLAHASSYPFSALHPAAPTRLTLTRGLLDAPTQRLADAFERDLRLPSAGASLDAIRRTRDLAWFDDLPTGGPLHLILLSLARRHLRVHGAHVGINPHPDLAERAREWRNLSYLLPADLLIASLAAADRTAPRTETVDLLTPQLAAHLRDGVAETHLHLGASVPFPYLWASLARDLADNPPSARDLSKGQPTLLGDGATMRAHLVLASLTRVLLAAFLLRHNHTGLTSTFGAFADAPLHAIADRLAWPSGADDAHRLLRAALVSFRRLDPASADVPRLISLYRHLVARPPLAKPRTLADIAARDPLAAAFPASPARALPETCFLASALRHLDEAGRSDALFATLFWTYVRVRTRLYQHLTQAPQTSGLDWFALHYDRISPLRRGLDPVLTDGALRHAARGVRLVSLEGRTAPEAAWHKVRDLVHDLRDQTAAFNRARPEAERVETGLVLHFIKRLTWKAGKAEFHELDPLGTGFRCGKWSTERAKEALAIEAALDHDPDLLVHLRGLDVANRELAIPAFCLVPLFGRVRRASERASARLGGTVEPMRATAHAGEDFRRLLQGVRRVHELIEFDLLRRGDRLGHGLALALDPRRWAEDAKIAVQPREERLDDLVWLLDRFGHGTICVSGSTIERTRVQALDLGREVYRRDLSTDDLVRARRLRHSERALARLGYPFFPERAAASGDRAEQLLLAYLTDGGVFERGQGPVEVLADDVDTELTRAAQAFVRREVVRLEITVETNPSSNLTIGDLGDVAEHPLFRMTPLHPSGPEPALLTTVNTDDPLTFATSLADEFAHLHFALQRKGVDGTASLAFLERVRAQALRAKFTLPASCLPSPADPAR